MKQLTMTARAKINLLLNVTGKRADGYHDIESIMQMVDFGDEVTVALAETPEIAISANVPGLPTDEKNIAFRAARLMQQTYHLSCGFRIHLEKKIPVAAGLAGGSTNAAAVMHLINRLCKLELSFEELAEKGVTLGADVPFCLYGKPALCEGIGEKLTPVEGLSDCYVVLVNPGVGVSTAAIYQAIDHADSPQGGDCKALIEALSQKKLSLAMQEMKNMMEPVAICECPDIEILLKKLKNAGASHSLMSGSGATCFGIFIEKPDEEIMKQLFGKNFVAIAEPVIK